VSFEDSYPRLTDCIGRGRHKEVDESDSKPDKLSEDLASIIIFESFDDFGGTVGGPLMGDLIRGSGIGAEPEGELLNS
jgi:hypothetical protein